MKKIFLTVAALTALLLVTDNAVAQGPGGFPGGTPAFAPSDPGCAQGGEAGANSTGLHPVLRRLFGLSRVTKKEKVNYLPVAQGGTLVFPTNPFIRSPRDFFMYDER